MPAPRGGRKPGKGKSGRPSVGPSAGKRVSRTPRVPRSPRVVPPVLDDGFAMEGPRPFRPAPDFRVESTAGLRSELIELRAEVHRLAAEIDKLWARERGRSTTPGRTSRSIAGKPARTGTRASRPGGRVTPSGRGPGGPKRSGAASRGPGGTKRAATGKRSSGWAKPKSRSRRSGTTPRRQGR